MNTVKYHLSHDGNTIGLFDSLVEAEHAAARDNGWTDAEIAEKWDSVKADCRKYGGDPLGNNGRDSLYFFVKLELDEQGNILTVDDEPFDDYIESISVEVDGKSDFEETKVRMTDYFLKIRQK